VNTVFTLESSYEDSAGSIFIGVFSSVQNAQQRIKEIMGFPRNFCLPDRFYISFVLLDIGQPILIETVVTKNVFK